MIGIDTNVLLRLPLRDDEVQFERVVSHIRTGAWDNGTYVNAVVLIEAIWVLTRRLGRSKADAIELIDRLLASQDIVIADELAVIAALDRYPTSNCDFADSLVAELNKSARVDTTFSFDIDAIKLEIFTPIP